jgi:hypothetical protein
MKVITWHLREVMAKHKISNRALAEKVGKHETTVTAWRNAETLPGFGGEVLGELLHSLSLLSGREIGLLDLLREE